MKIFQKRDNLYPFEIDWVEEYLKILYTNPWQPWEVEMKEDLKHWQQAPESIKKVISGILMGFTETEVVVGDFNLIFLAELLKAKPELVAVCRKHADQELLHAIAYHYLEDTLGLNTYPAFKSTPTSFQKYNHIVQCLNEKSYSLRDKLEKLVIFSVGVEGVSLFSSFLVLLSFSIDNKFPGLSQILSWSVRDENNHSDFGIKLFNLITKEYPNEYPLIDYIHESIDNIVQYELSFIENAFQNGNLPNLTLLQVKNFIYHKANKKLGQLGYSKLYNTDYDQVKSVLSWFNPLVESTVHHDFFDKSRNGSAYTAKVNLKEFDKYKIQRMLLNI